MTPLTSTLLADGSSDRVLIPFIQALLQEHCDLPIAETAMASAIVPVRAGLRTRIQRAVELFPCKVLFVHRDAERVDTVVRQEEIHEAVRELRNPPHFICVIPVRMTEAWLLTQEMPIRRAVGNPQGSMRLDIPRIREIEDIAQPKEELFKLLRSAKDVGRRRLRSFSPEQHRHKVGEFTEDLAPLRGLPSFAHLEDQIKAFFQPRIFGRR